MADSNLMICLSIVGVRGDQHGHLGDRVASAATLLAILASAKAPKMAREAARAPR